jgi:hypothetical protein
MTGKTRRSDYREGDNDTKNHGAFLLLPRWHEQRKAVDFSSTAQ